MTVREVPTRSSLRQWTVLGVVLVGPVIVAGAFPHPVDRVIIPGSVMLALVFLVTISGSRSPASRLR